MNTIGRRIRQVRLQRGLTQEQVALQAGLGQNVVHIAERRTNAGMQVETLARIARVLRVPVGVLVGELPVPPRTRVVAAGWTVHCDQCGPVCTTATEDAAAAVKDDHDDWHLAASAPEGEVAA